MRRRQHALLANIPAGASANFCGGAGTARVFNPKPAYYESVETESVAGKNDAGLVAQMLKADQLAKDRDEDCRQADRAADEGWAIRSRAARPWRVPSQDTPQRSSRSLVSEYDVHLPVPKQIAVRVIDVPLDDRTVEIRVWSSGPLKPVITPAAEAIVGSAAIQ